MNTSENTSDYCSGEKWQSSTLSNGNVEQAWTTRREPGSVFAMKLAAWFALTFGRAFSRLWLYPICLYFMIFAPRGRRASRQYLSKVLQRPATWREVFRHHYYFGTTMLDRAFVRAGRYDKFEITRHGVDEAHALIKRGQGCLLLGAHLGSFEFAHYYGVQDAGLVINTLMYDDNAKKLNKVLDGMGGRGRVITIGNIDSLLRAQERIEQGELLAILGDRVAASEKIVTVPFFGAPAVFPAGPILLANALRVPVILFFGLYLGGNRYAEHCELFAPEIRLDPRQRQADLEKWVQRYVARLEHYCRQAPYNWFNFFDFWERRAVARTSDRDESLATEF